MLAFAVNTLVNRALVIVIAAVLLEATFAILVSMTTVVISVVVLIEKVIGAEVPVVAVVIAWRS